YTTVLHLHHSFRCVTNTLSLHDALPISLYNGLFAHFNPFTKEKPGAHTEMKGLSDIDKVILIDQSPIGRTPRSNPATYTGIFSIDRKSTRLNSSHGSISYAVFCLKKTTL